MAATTMAAVISLVCLVSCQQGPCSVALVLGACGDRVQFILVM